MKPFAVCLLLLATPAFAVEHAPLPESVITAKTVYIVNQAGRQEIQDNAVDQFSKWGRYTLAKSRQDTDLLVVFGADDYVLTMKVFPRGSEDAAFQDTSRWSRFNNPAKNCISDFKKRVERQ